MFYVHPSLNYKNLSKENKSFLALPSKLVNNFLVRSLDKFGIIEAPDKLIEMILNKPEASLKMEKGYSSIYCRPVYNNSDYLFQIALDKMKAGEDIYSKPEAAAMFFEWYVLRNQDKDFEIKIDTEKVLFEDLAKAYSKASTKSFHPNDLEMLLKLFSLFYAKELNQKEIENISKMQTDLEKMADKKVDKLEYLRIIYVKPIIERIAEINTSFGTNNIFNKILEEINKIESLLHFGYEIDNYGEYSIFKHTWETKNLLRKDFIEFMEAI